MGPEWILQKRETRRFFANATWIPLRESVGETTEDCRRIGYVSDYKGCGSVAFYPQYRELAEKLGWSDIGISCDTRPHAYDDGDYSPIEQYEYSDKEPIGVHLVYEYIHPVVGGRQWVLSPDLVAALGLIKEGTNWVRPEENFAVVAREVLNERGDHCLIEIKREFLLDYLAARDLSLRLSCYRQRLENVASLESSAYVNLKVVREERENGRFELRINPLEKIFGGTFAVFRAWRTDVDEDDDAPIMAAESGDNTEFETFEGYGGGYEGVQVEGEFWRDEWIEHQGRSTRVRGDVDSALPQFIVETDGTRTSSADLDNEEVGRWLWFSPSVVNELIGLRGFTLKWYTAETGGISSTSGYVTHFGVNSSDLVTVYAADIARLGSWEQRLWASHNVLPEGKVSAELLSAQVGSKPAQTKSVEVLFFEAMQILEDEMHRTFGIPLYTHEVDKIAAAKHISRFQSRDLPSLLRLAKELVRVFSDRLNVSDLRKLSTHSQRDKLGSNKLLQDLLAQITGPDDARSVFSPIVGAYDMRVGDAHPTSSKIIDACKLAGIDDNLSFLRQGEQLIANYGRAIFKIGKSLYENQLRSNTG